MICCKFAITEGKLEIGLDGESVIKKLRSPFHPNPSDSHYDLLMDCRGRMKALPIDITYRWVEGHQDDKGHAQSLDWWAIQNIRMDHAAKSHWGKTKNQPRPNHVFQYEKWAVAIMGQKLSSFRKEEVHERTHEEAIKQYWTAKHNITDAQWQDINWKAAKTAQKEQPLGKNRWAWKNSTDHCATGRMMLRRKEWVNSKCPVCGAPDETTRHVQQCRDERCRARWKASMDALKTWMTEVDTEPCLIRLLLTTLNSWVDEAPTANVPSNGPRSRKAIEAQLALGGWNTLLGRISTQVQERQEDRYRRKKSRRSGFRWTVALIKKLQDIAWDMWDHRNGILHGDPDRHHRKGEVEQADANIVREWQRGDAGLLQEDRFLFRNPQEQVLARTLELKWQWLTSVTGARAAADAASRANDSYSVERQGMRNFLAGRRTRTHETNNTDTQPPTSRRRIETETDIRGTEPAASRIR
jgi:hypothetical protein